MTNDGFTPPKPLDAEEQAHVRNWQGWMYRYYAFAAVMMLLAFGVAQRYGESAVSQLFVLVTVVALIVAATVVQFTGKCPRCQTRLGRQTKLALPAQCRACGVEFPRP